MFSEMGHGTERDSDDTAFQPSPFDVRALGESSGLCASSVKVPVTQ